LKTKELGRRRVQAAQWALVTGVATITFVTLWTSGFDFKRVFNFKGESVKPIAVVPAVIAAAPVARPIAPAAPALSVAFPGINSTLSDSPKRLILTGTVLGRNAREGSAFIGIDARNPQTYVAGAMLANGARLTQVYADHVVLERHGRTATLYLVGRQPRSLQDKTGDLLMVGGRPPYQPAVANSSEEFTDYIRPAPVYDGPNLRGYQLYAGAQAAVFSQLGLRPGDVMTAVDGETFTDPAQAMELFRQLATGISMRATVTRDGRALEISLDGSLIVAAQERARAPRAGTATIDGMPRS
jgi:general secretion pathway protein C